MTKNDGKTLFISTQNHSIVCINSSCTLAQEPEHNNITKNTIPVLKKTIKVKVKSYHVNLSLKVNYLTALQWCNEYDMKLASIKTKEDTEKFINTTKLPVKSESSKI